MALKFYERFLLHSFNAFMFFITGFVIGFLTTTFLLHSTTFWLLVIGGLTGLGLWYIWRATFFELLLSNSIYQIGLSCTAMVGIFGFFMGVPVVNLLPGILLAYITGLNARRKQVQAADFNRLLRRTSWISLTILGLFLVASAVIALLDPYTGMNLQGMLGLKKEVTQGQLLMIIFVGGFVLMSTQLLLGRFIGKRAYVCRLPDRQAR